MKLVFDIETDGLNATKIWCIVAKDLDNNQVYGFPPDQIDQGIELLEGADLLIGHNILGFDIPVLKELTDINFDNKKIIDTLVLSRLAKPERDGHGLQAWGYKLNRHKGLMEERDFQRYTPNMLDYCINDVELNSLVFDNVIKELDGFDTKSIKIEHDVSHILKEQEKYGFLFNSYKGEMLLAKLNERKTIIEDEVQEVFKPKKVKIKTVVPKFKNDGELSKQGLTEEEYNCLSTQPVSRVLAFDRYKIQEFNLASRKQIGEYLKEFGWKPKKFTPTGQPIVDEGTLKNVKDIPEAKLIAEFLLLQKRIAQVSSWFKHLGGDNRVHGFVIPNGAITGRMAHVKPNMAQVPSINSPYGKECRECWIVPNGYKLVGIDASGLELRMLAHYMNDKEFTNEILTGDIHTANQKLAGLESRNQAKTFIYAFIYGAGDAKLGSVVGRSRKDGKILRQRFLTNLPALATLKDKVERAARRGYLKGLDGRHISVRNEYSALNTLLQSAGAIVMKQGLIKLHDKIKEDLIDAHFVANIHDEWQIEVYERHACIVGELGVQCIREVADDFHLRCPLDGEYSIGDNWSETH